MKIKNNLKIAAFAVTTIVVFATLSTSARADVYWNGTVSSDWSDPANWINGLPSAGGAGNAVINPWGSFQTPIVSTLGNTTVGQLYLAPGGGLNIVGGGQLSTVDLITGNWGSSSAVNITGGTLSISGILNMGVNGNDGDVIISSGTITAPTLSINTAGGASLDISGTGSFITAFSQLGNINYWVANNAITANGGASGWLINIDQVSNPGNLVLTAVPTPEPSALAIAVTGGVASLILILRRRQTQ